MPLALGAPSVTQHVGELEVGLHEGLETRHHVCRLDRHNLKALFILIALCCSLSATAQVLESGTKSDWKLVWSDEFSGPNGSAPDSAKWVIETGGGGWGNEELETYTKHSANLHQQNGNLVITARQEDFTGRDGIARHFTSARLKTASKFSQQYGRFEARIKIPSGQGIWPAFWMLGDDRATVKWPECGEIDIMENVGFEPSTVHGSMHGPGYSGGNPLTGKYDLPRGQRFSDDFHVFAVEWEPNTVRFYVDDALYETRTPADLPAGKRWVYDHPFFLLLNVAVGGRWPGNPDQSTVFPQSMLVDYVRVYTRGGIQPGLSTPSGK